MIEFTGVLFFFDSFLSLTLLINWSLAIAHINLLCDPPLLQKKAWKQLLLSSLVSKLLMEAYNGSKQILWEV
ncbi:MAG: hypothetical protein QXP36_10420 [Conexivisphaerales archaeon]